VPKILLCFQKNIFLATTYKFNHLKIKYNISALIIALVFLFFKSEAQDIHFTQFYSQAQMLNPAQTGYFEGDWRVAAIYRNQWRSIDKQPFTTIGVGADKPFRIYSDQINAGILLLNDQSGVVNLTSNRVYLSLSYLKKFGGHSLAFGIQPGYVFDFTDVNKYTYDEQFELGSENVFNSDLPNGEDMGNNINFFDINAGVLWAKQLTKAFKPEVGYTAMHLTNPYRSFKGVKDKSTRFGLRHVFHGGGSLTLGKKLRLKPNILYMYQTKATDMLLGTNVEIDLPSKSLKTVYVGTLFRYGWEKNYDASSWILGIIYKNVNVGFSYDINISSLQEATNNRGAWEISLVYISPSTKLNKIQIPCDRY